MQNDTPRIVSVIITNFNYGHFLVDALESVSAQTYQNWECLIIDDGSTDNSEEIVKKYTQKDSRFRYIYQHNQGLAASRNNGMAVAKGCYFQFLDADDKICARKLFEQAKFLDAHKEIDIVYGDYSYFETDSPQLLLTSKSKEKLGQIDHPSGQGQFMLDKLIYDNFTVVSAPMIRRSIYDQGIKFDTSYNTFEDWKFWIDCSLANCNFKYFPLAETETHIRFGHSSMMSALLKMNLGGQKIRRYLHSHLNFGQKVYNIYRMVKLVLKYCYIKTYDR
jgi:glycosyltransferase involved in cell wall biosynthesis